MRETIPTQDDRGEAACDDGQKKGRGDDVFHGESSSKAHLPLQSENDRLVPWMFRGARPILITACGTAFWRARKCPKVLSWVAWPGAFGNVPKDGLISY
jgi:hypothetical protein